MSTMQPTSAEIWKGISAAYFGPEGCDPAILDKGLQDLHAALRMALADIEERDALLREMVALHDPCAFGPTCKLSTWTLIARIEALLGLDTVAAEERKE